MKIERVELTNIRQFVGHQIIEFSVEDNNNITLIHGPNTAGKTTLLNAVHWCLYGEFLAGFKEQNRLKSEQSEGDDFGVEVQFEHHGIRYVARRVGKDHPKSAVPTVLERRSNGQMIVHPQPELLVNSILPKALARYFLFAGEMIQADTQTVSSEAIRSVLGLSLAEQAIVDLKEIRKKKQRELQTLSEGSDLARVTNELVEAESAVDLISAQLVQLRQVVNHLEVTKRGLFDQLRDIESSSNLQRRRDANIAALGRTEQAHLSASAARQELIGLYGSSLFLGTVAAQAISFIEEGVTRKRIPSPFDKTFVEDILKSHVCICGGKIEEGSKEYRAVASLVNDATDENTIRRVLSARGIAGMIASESRNAPRAFVRAMQQLKAAQEEIERLEQEKARIKDLLDRHESHNVREKEAQLDNVERKLREMVGSRDKGEQDVEDKKRLIATLKTERDRAQAVSPQVEQARRTLGVIDKLVEALEEELTTVEARGIASISSALNSIVSKSTRAKYFAEVTGEYVLNLYKGGQQATRIPVLVLSSGERRLLDLCFFSSLVSVCRDREKETDALLLPGAVAPLMVDAPFGELDPEYQALAATTMRALAGQLILMLSKTHWTPAVDEAIRPFIGREYLLVGYRTGSALEAKTVETMINGHTYQQMHYEADMDWTQIVQVGRSAK